MVAGPTDGDVERAAETISEIKRTYPGVEVCACFGLLSEEQGSDSVPVNFLIPFKGTPLGQRWSLTPQRCLRILAMVRFVCPDVEVRVAGGREIHLRSLQPMALYLANSIFLGDYLTSEGQEGNLDLQMISDLGQGKRVDRAGAGRGRELQV